MNKINKNIFSIGAFALLLGTAIACSEEEPVNMPPSFKLYDVTNVMRTSATFSGSISGNLNHIKAFGFQYSQSEEFSSSLTKEIQVGEQPSTGVIEQKVTGLEGGEQYYYRMYASTGASKVYSSSEFFQTERSSAPTMSALIVDSIGENMARFKCTIEEIGDEYLIECGVSYKESGSNTWIPFASDSIVPGTTNTFFVEITGLEAATKYSFRPYAKNSADKTGEETGTREGYGAIEEHTTANQLSAVVETVEPVEGKIGMNSVEMSGRVTSAIGSNGVVDEVGFCYSSTNRTPIVTDSYVVGTFTKLNEYFTTSVSDLNTGTTYYVRAYAKNTVNGQERIGYGKVFEITTTNIATPNVEWIPEGHDEVNGYDYYTDNSTATTIIVKAKITNYDKGALVEKGFIWDKSRGEITLEEAKKNKTFLSLDLEIGENILNGTITGLEIGQSYYIRPYAVYKVSGFEEIGYASWSRSIRTKDFEYPSLDNVEVPDADITRKSAKLIGKISSNGNGEISERGFCMSYVTTTYEPTLANSDFIFKSDETFTNIVTDLKSNTEYAVRSYVISKLEAKVDTTYSDWRTCFWTKDIVRPTFNNVVVNDSTITFNSFALSTKLVDKGDGELIEKGFCWTEGWNDLTLETALGCQKVEGDDFVATLTGLKPETDYSFKAYAKVKVDDVEYVYYSDQRSASTQSIYFDNFRVDDATKTFYSFTLSTEITNMGSAEFVEKGFCWVNEWTDFTLETAVGRQKVEGDSFVATITGLTPNTNYVYRAYVKLMVNGEVCTYYSVLNSTNTKYITRPNFSKNCIGISATSFTFELHVNDYGDGDVIEKGILWQKAPEDGSWQDFTLEKGADGIVKCEVLTNDVDTLDLSGLEISTGYHVNAYMKMKLGDYEYVTYDGGWGSSTSNLNLGINETQETATEISLTGYINEVIEGITEYGFCWSADDIDVSKMTNMTKASDLDTNNQFKATIKELSPNTKYYIGVYAKIGDKVYFGDGRWEISTKGYPSIDSNPSPSKKD